MSSDSMTLSSFTKDVYHKPGSSVYFQASIVYLTLELREQTRYTPKLIFGMF